MSALVRISIYLAPLAGSVWMLRSLVPLLKAAARMVMTLFMIVPSAHTFYFGGIPWGTVIDGAMIGAGVVVVLLALARVFNQ